MQFRAPLSPGAGTAASVFRTPTSIICPQSCNHLHLSSDFSSVAASLRRFVADGLIPGQIQSARIAACGPCGRTNLLAGRTSITQAQFAHPVSCDIRTNRAARGRADRPMSVRRPRASERNRQGAKSAEAAKFL